MSRTSEITPEVPRRSTARRVTLFVLGFVACLALLNFGARWYLQNHGTNLGYRIVHAKWQLLESMDEPVDWLVLGDSSGCHGIVPEVLGEELGGTAVNLATLANLLVVDDAWMLQRYIKRFGPPKNVVLVHAFDVWHRGYNSTLIGQVPRPWGFWKRVPPTIDFTPPQERRLFLSRFVPLYAENSTLRAHLSNLGPPEELAFSITESGWVPGRPHGPRRFASDLARTHRFLRGNDRFRLSQLNVDALNVIGKLSEKHGFPVYLVNGPMHDTTAERADFQRYQGEKQARLHAQTSDFSRFHVLDTLAVYPTLQMEVYVDHVIPEMAPDYTRKVARAVARERALHRPAGEPAVPEKPPWPPEITGAHGGDKERVKLVFGGDASLARGVGGTMKIDRDPAKTLAGVAPLTSTADLAFVNLECVLTGDDAKSLDKQWPLRADPALASGLADVGIDVVSVANNHTLDFGWDGYLRTLEAAESHGLKTIGSVWADGAQPPLVMRAGRYTVGWLAYNDGGQYHAAADPQGTRWPKPANADPERIVADIERLRPHVDVVVVAMHWGFEYSLLESEAQRTSGRRFIDAGADLIIGQGTHTPQVVERYGSGLIAYSLGDFVFDKGTPYKRLRCGRRFMLEVEWGPTGRAGHRLLPIGADGRFRPHPDPALDVKSFEYVAPGDTFAFSRSLATLRVERSAGGSARPCDQHTTQPPRRPKTNGYMKWLRDRWRCADDTERPWLTVARTAERASSVRRVGLWAHPEPAGPLRITAPRVTLGQQLVGFAGVPDWPLALAGKDPPPVTLRVLVDGESLAEIVVPVVAGWQPLAIDTADRAGQSAEVTVEVEGGPAVEFGFVFDLEVAPVRAVDP